MKLIQSLGTWKPAGGNNECGISLNTEHVFGGRNAKLGEYPFAALIGYLINKKIYYTCGGSILNSKYILTAAHCDTEEMPIQ